MNLPIYLTWGPLWCNANFHNRNNFIGHMVWQDFLKNKHFKIFFSRTAWQIEGKLHLHVPQALGIPGCSQIINRSHCLAAILVWTKFFFKSFSWTASSIDVKCHNYDLVVMGNMCFKFQHDWKQSGSQNFLIFWIWVQGFKSNLAQVCTMM